MTGNLKTGTSGIMVSLKKQDYPEEFRNASRLRFYSSVFNSIEINSTFHKLPLASTLSRWSGDVPENFRFTLKLWKPITHIKNLEFKREDLERFMEIAQHIGDKKGCLLVQFPGSISSDFAEKAEAILEMIAEWEQGWKVAVEFRNVSWYHQQTWEMLKRYNSSLVFHDFTATAPSRQSYITDTVYLRYHGPSGKYRDSYTDEFLKDQAVQVRDWLSQGRDVYVYFNNTAGGALENASFLKRLLSQE